MAHDVLMPQMGESIAEGTVTTWLKKVGERVERDQPLFEVATDKVDAEIPSPATGVLKEIKAQPGTTVPIGSIVAVIAAEGESSEAAPAPAAAPAAAKPGSPQGQGGAAVQDAPATARPDSTPGPQAGANVQPAAAASQGPAPKSSPLVRKIAQEHQVDVRSVPGTGQGGRVTKNDILGHLGGQKAPGAAVHSGATGSPAVATAAAVAPAPAGVAGHALPGPHEVPENYRARVFEGDRVEDLGGMRSKIAEHMVLSKRISPHVGTVWEIDFTHLGKLRQKFKKVWEERYGVNLTYTTFIIKAAVDALKAFPVCNASVDGNKVIYHQNVNMGLAVALDWGLIVPVIHGADELNTLGLARRAQDLALRARNKKLKPAEVQAGTFTITNPGSFGPMFNLPIINQPQVAILGVGTVEKRPVVIDDMLAIRTRAYLSLSFDHRLVDGAVADQFMAHIKKNIENFEESEL